ncbi:MAG: YebC/PmpR family DNA-binding transcriptional regulator [Chloroflexi bacterium]|nr:MAG: YebC/PmpR family DNA-binding transcriptional regulator [Anaerolineaceae bacterium 4572_32.2]RLC74519.1 MAG: YebC/PmpR family DNA-binding transcriptional regulator [Chloroflexota bacterium]RLC81161.1 MAG: YebC/PmpR family DNA-binding transcriptional regulator [Chloroflexota bacterium]HEY73513.1 YebC/PmpR family DNA-binding transcriptional regulator [Thermoflexia bacterium]
MSGHSKWKTIKHKKAATDAKRGKIFTRLGREITIAARAGGGDPNVNFNLRLAVDKAKSANMPKDNIERAIKRGTGELKGEELAEVTYEGYAPHGVALLVQVLTDNKNRTVADVRRILTRQGGTLAEAGAVAWQFERKGYIAIEPDGVDEDNIFEVAVEAGAEDVVFGDNMIEIYAELSDFQAVRQALENAGIEFETSELAMIPQNTLQLEEKGTLQVMGVIEALEDLDDTQQVYSNLDISDEVMSKYEAAS